MELQHTDLEQLGGDVGSSRLEKLRILRHRFVQRKTSLYSILLTIVAWATIAGWQAETASAAYLIGSLIQGIVVLTHPTYSPQPFQTMLFLWAVLLFVLFFNCITSRALARFEGGFLVLHLAGFFAVLIPLVLLGPHGDASSVFLTFLNNGNWSTQALSFFVGLPSSVFALFGMYNNAAS